MYKWQKTSLLSGEMGSEQSELRTPGPDEGASTLTMRSGEYTFRNARATTSPMLLPRMSPSPFLVSLPPKRMYYQSMCRVIKGFLVSCDRFNSFAYSTPFQILKGI